MNKDVTPDWLYCRYGHAMACTKSNNCYITGGVTPIAAGAAIINGYGSSGARPLYISRQFWELRLGNSSSQWILIKNKVGVGGDWNVMGGAYEKMCNSY